MPGLCSENPSILPGSLPDFSRIYTFKTPKKFTFIGLKLHNDSISYWLLIVDANLALILWFSYRSFPSPGVSSLTRG